MRPTPEQLRSALERRLPDVIADGLEVLFVGINPGLYSAAVGHHFARPGNRFYPALARAGLTPLVIAPEQDRELLRYGLGITNFVSRTTARAAELELEELREGARALAHKVARYAPRKTAVLGVTAYRAAFERPQAKLGLQSERLVDSELWVLPNPSGLNAHHQLDALARMFAQLRG